jgi:hypothetical protein
VDSLANQNLSLSLVDAFNISADEKTPSPNTVQKYGSESDEESQPPQTTEEYPSDTAKGDVEKPQLLSISDIFNFVPEPVMDPATPTPSPKTTSLSDDTSDQDLNSPEVFSIMDVFSNDSTGADRNQEHPSQSSSGEETLDDGFMDFDTDLSITDIFSATATDVTTTTLSDVTTEKSSDSMASLDRPSLTGHVSNLSTISFESTLSKVRVIFKIVFIS